MKLNLELGGRDYEVDCRDVSMDELDDIKKDLTARADSMASIADRESMWANVAFSLAVEARLLGAMAAERAQTLNTVCLARDRLVVDIEQLKRSYLRRLQVLDREIEEVVRPNR